MKEEMVEQTVNQKAIDHRLEMITRNLNDKQKKKLCKDGVNMKNWLHQSNVFI